MGACVAKSGSPGPAPVSSSGSRLSEDARAPPDDPRPPSRGDAPGGGAHAAAPGGSPPHAHARSPPRPTARALARLDAQLAGGAADRSPPREQDAARAELAAGRRAGGSAGDADGRGGGAGAPDEAAEASVPGSPPLVFGAGPGADGEHVIRWQRGELIGKGAFGRVFLGLNEESGELMAVKEVELQGETLEKALEHLGALETEVATLRNLHHPNIVRYVGTERTKHCLNIFLEFVPGGSIAGLLSKFGSFSEKVIRVYNKQILQGLEYLHRHQIMHRDIKGANILVDNSGVVKLADFGASKKIEDLVTIASGYKSLKGTPYWMAPEVIKQTGHGRPADIWSVGCTVIEMATGKPPWSEFASQVSALFHIASSKGPPPIPEHLSMEARDFLLLCFIRVPKDRPNATRLLQHPFCTQLNVTPPPPRPIAPPAAATPAPAVAAAAAAAAGPPAGPAVRPVLDSLPPPEPDKEQLSSRYLSCTDSDFDGMRSLRRGAPSPAGTVPMEALSIATDMNPVDPQNVPDEFVLDETTFSEFSGALPTEEYFDTSPPTDNGVLRPTSANRGPVRLEPLGPPMSRVEDEAELLNFVRERAAGEHERLTTPFRKHRERGGAGSAQPVESPSKQQPRRSRGASSPVPPREESPTKQRPRGGLMAPTASSAARLQEQQSRSRGNSREQSRNGASPAPSTPLARFRTATEAVVADLPVDERPVVSTFAREEQHEAATEQLRRTKQQLWEAELAKELEAQRAQKRGQGGRTSKA